MSPDPALLTVPTCGRNPLIKRRNRQYKLEEGMFLQEFTEHALRLLEGKATSPTCSTGAGGAREVSPTTSERERMGLNNFSGLSSDLLESFTRLRLQFFAEAAPSTFNSSNSS